MYWEKEIRIRLTTRRIMGIVLVASTAVNLIIVGTVFGTAPSTPIPTPTPSITNTNELVFATLVAPPSTTSESLTSTPIPTFTVPSATTETFTELPTLSLCVLRSYWPVYYVQKGDTLFSLARITGSTVEELMLANCLSGGAIYPGQLLYVPRIPFKTLTPTQTSRPTDTATATQSITPTDSSTATPTNTSTVTPTNTSTHTSTPPGPPDLVVTYLQIAGPGAINANARIDVPVRVGIKNQGGTEAGIFKVAIQYIDPTGGRPYFVPFTVEGEENTQYPFTRSPLPPGAEITFAGILSFSINLQGQTVSLIAMADSCSGDELFPVYCRVLESNESNNETQPVPINLPSNVPPNVTINYPKVGTEYTYDGYDSETLAWYKNDVNLSGYATDSEDGVLDGSSLTWFRVQTDVSKDPIILGHGASLTVTLLSDECGTDYTITLSAQDSDGNETTVTRTIAMSCPLY